MSANVQRPAHDEVGLRRVQHADTGAPTLNKDLKAHDEANSCGIGDRVLIDGVKLNDPASPGGGASDKPFSEGANKDRLEELKAALN